MNKEKLIEVFHQSCQSWLDQDKNLFLTCLHENIRYEECYGQVYLGKKQISDWFSDFHSNGMKVTRWDIKSSFFDDDKGVLVAEWDFECVATEGTFCFLGCSVVKFMDQQMIEVREYKMDGNKVYPYI